MISAALAEEVRAHDEAMRAEGLDLWIGAEPTFTDRTSLDPWWLYQAEGGDKEERARALLTALHRRLGGAGARAQGRRYPGEELPRFAYGLAWSRGTNEVAAGSLELDGEPVPPPEPDPARAWLTVTPDPGVVEVNMAPAPSLAQFAQWVEATFAAAAEAGLAPLRYRYNGEITDSGGGGQLTFGGATAQTSPLLRRPHVLTGLLRYLNHHPSLSYYFAGECRGSASQGPRPDEGVMERFEELGLALDRLESEPAPVDPAWIWETLAPLLVDCSGNTHRAEVNVEKLWNPHLPGRGKLGVIELRALRMEPTPERLVAVALLFRSLLLRLALVPFTEPLRWWGRSLHDRYGLPAFLEADLAAVLADLERHGCGLGPGATDLVTTTAPEPLVRADLGTARLSVHPAVEFWPLVGDVASQEGQTSRLVDSSAQRLEVRVDVVAGEAPGRVVVAGREVSLTRACDTRWVTGLRYRAYEPRPGLHPGLPSVDPLCLVWARGAEALEVVIHGWRPDGSAYDGLPGDPDAARRRCRERVLVRPTPPPPPAPPLPDTVVTVDVRGLHAGR